MHRFIALGFVLFALSGCSTVMELEDKWSPLRFIKQSKTLAIGASARTIGDSFFVSDLKDWLEDHPEPLFSAVVTHERVHSVRQLSYKKGLTAWIARYLTDKEFMWHEEQLGYYYHITYLHLHGGWIDVDSWADGLSGYVSALGFMISKSDAKTWLESVVAGNWHPTLEEQDQINH